LRQPAQGYSGEPPGAGPGPFHAPLADLLRQENQEGKQQAESKKQAEEKLGGKQLTNEVNLESDDNR